ncbi:MAG: ABC transporter ATP-binding protein [Clostridiales bacterium]|nr:ABC transporter ATP-binding protein [Clostridiales bacterium]
MIRLENICKIYGKKQASTKALTDISLEVGDGEMVAIVGTSGSGKTTLLNILGAMSRPDSGTYFYGERDVTKLDKNALNNFRRDEVGFVFQYFELMEQYTVLENVEMPLLPKGVRGRERRERAMDCLARLGIEKLSQRRPGSLSGGQRQRCAIARAIVGDCGLILADEPTGALDNRTTGDILDVFGEINAAGRTVIIITHDMEVASRCGRVLQIEDGRIVE